MYDDSGTHVRNAHTPQHVKPSEDIVEEEQPEQASFGSSCMPPQPLAHMQPQPKMFQIRTDILYTSLQFIQTFVLIVLVVAFLAKQK
jgi:hypothetical protein